jgi:small-conductance mechanosensitive channel
MTEEFDALQRFNLLTSVGLIVGLLILGVVLELVLRLAQRWTEKRDWRFGAVVLGAMHWLPLFWCVLIAAAMLLAGFSDVSVERQRGIQILWALLLISITIVAVRILTGWVNMLAEQRPSASVSVLRYQINGAAILIVVTVILYTLNIPMPLLLLTILGSTLGLSLAMREPLSNLFAGVLLTASQRLSPGDFVAFHLAKKDVLWTSGGMSPQSDNHAIVKSSYRIRI